MSLPALSDSLALQLLSTVAGPRLQASAGPPPSAPDLLAALTEAFGPAADGPAITDGDLARAALALAAEDPATAAAIEARAESTGLEAFPVGETMALVGTVTMAVAILQTEITFERGTAGKWKIKLNKKPASDTLLKGLAQAILRALGGGEAKPAPRLPK